MEILNKAEQTIAIAAQPITAIVAIWFNADVALYTEATAGLLISIIEYVKLFIKK